MIGAGLLAVLSGAVSFLIADAIRRHGVRLGFSDLPNSRSLHTRLTPRGGGGGFVLMVPLLTGWAMHVQSAPSVAEGVLLADALALGAVGLADDRWGLPAGVRLVAQCIAALTFVWAGGLIREIVVPGADGWSLGALSGPVTVLWLVGLTNIYNFMDGIDGLAAGQAIVAAISMCVLALHLGRADIGIAMAILAAGVAGFLVLNWAPASIFMGDGGSTFLGFTLAGWAVLSGGRRGAPLPLVAWMAVLSPFLFDSALTLVRRALRREPLHKAHRSHIYQLLVQDGWSHAQVSSLYIALAVSAGILTILHFGFHLVAARTYVAGTLLPLVIPVALLAARRVQS